MVEERNVSQPLLLQVLSMPHEIARTPDTNMDPTISDGLHTAPARFSSDTVDLLLSKGSGMYAVMEMRNSSVVQKHDARNFAQTLLQVDVLLRPSPPAPSDNGAAQRARCLRNAATSEVTV